MAAILPSIACNLDANLLRAALPLLEAEKVQAMEWSFDALYRFPVIPDWFTELLHVFSRENRLIGHGVYFSLFSGKWSAEQADWLVRLKKLSAEYRFDHITEHFGFMTGADFHAGAPISLPYTPVTLAIGRDRLARISDACQCPVGLENLAFSYSLDEVKKHGEFLAALIEPVNGFIILDLHNLYCQLHNFDLGWAALAQLYPLERVREIHISGGSWAAATTEKDRPVRRDTHDDAVPSPVFQLLDQALDVCPNLKYVVLEQLGTALDTEAERRVFQRDFDTMSVLITRKNAAGGVLQNLDFRNPHPAPAGPPMEDEHLHRQQAALSDILENAADLADARRRLVASELAGTAWEMEHWAPFMLETALEIAQKWKHGFAEATRKGAA